MSVAPLAMQRPPSQITPDVDGSNPFNYVRLVQPVLDRNCVECHQEKKALDLTGAIEQPNGWTRSYANLAAKYGFYFDVTNGSIAGRARRDPYDSRPVRRRAAKLLGIFGRAALRGTSLGRRPPSTAVVARLQLRVLRRL